MRPPVIFGVNIAASVLLAVGGAVVAQNCEAKGKNSASAPSSSNSQQSPALAPMEACVAKGVAYFKKIGSFPTLSDGRSATQVAYDRCGRTVKAFDL
jgi:hypothetical protein